MYNIVTLRQQIKLYSNSQQKHNDRQHKANGRNKVKELLHLTLQSVDSLRHGNVHVRQAPGEIRRQQSHERRRGEGKADLKGPQVELGRRLATAKPMRMRMANSEKRRRKR